MKIIIIIIIIIAIFKKINNDLYSNFNSSEIIKNKVALERSMNRPTPVKYIPGHPIKPSNSLLNWLNKNYKNNQGIRRKLLIPVVIIFKDIYKLEIKTAYIGISEKITEDDIFLSLDDTAMGISLLSQLQYFCLKNVNICKLWIEGLWGPLLDIRTESSTQTQKNKKNYTFTVLKIDKKIIEQQEKEVTVYIESN